MESMKVAINKQGENKYEVGYYVGNKLNYHIMESKEAIQYIKGIKPKKVISNNVTLKINNEESLELDSLTLRMMNVAKKIKNKSFLFIEINTKIRFYFFDGIKIEVLEKRVFQNRSKLSARTNCDYYKFNKKYHIYTSLYDSLIMDDITDLEKVYEGYLKNDYVCKVIIEKILLAIDNDILKYKQKYSFDDVVLGTKFNHKINSDSINLKSGLKINLEKINKRDNLRMILNVSNKE